MNREGSTYSCQHCSQLGILSNWIHSLILNYCFPACVRDAMIMYLMMAKPEGPHEFVSGSVVLNSSASSAGKC